MARARSRQATVEGRYLAARVVAAKRRGVTNAEIARVYGINERTVRKLASGETSGRKTFGRLVGATRDEPEGVNLSIQRLVIEIGRDERGEPVYRTVNAKLPMLRTASGRGVAMTQADLILYPHVETIVDAEVARLTRQYGDLVVSGRGRIARMLPIARRQKPLAITIEGRFAP